MKHLSNYLEMVDDLVSQAKQLCVTRWLLLLFVLINLDLPFSTLPFSKPIVDLEWTDLPIVLGGWIAWGAVVLWRRKVAERKVRAKHRVVIDDLDRRLDQRLNGADAK